MILFEVHLTELSAFSKKHEGHNGSYYIIVERMWTTWSVLYYCRRNVDNMVRIILL
jgi:hypothetical protein